MVAEMSKVAALVPPHSWLKLPEHRVVQVVAATEGRELPHEQESVGSAGVSLSSGVTYCP